ncbi:putative major facilitator transporter [Gordonia amicalis NBRC 100051 = JCM 11271]|nr:putative major facilitator transporter [Gordonia amicalis NBRC 100051 = JCM 11271]
MSQTQGQLPQEGTEQAPAGAVGSVVALCFGGLVASLMQTLIIPIQPDLPRLLGTSIGNASWIITATLLAAAVAMPIAGRLGDMFGKQRVLLASAVLLTLGSLLCAVGDSLVPLIIGRGVQGLAMGFIPVGMSLIREITPPHITSMAVAAMSATLGVGGAIGLPLSRGSSRRGTGMPCSTSRRASVCSSSPRSCSSSRGSTPPPAAASTSPVPSVWPSASRPS